MYQMSANIWSSGCSKISISAKLFQVTLSGTFMSTTSMSHSTTATSAYIVLKYSKSHPPTPSIQTEQNPPNIQTGSGRDTSAEWQHFFNPVIRLVLDVKKSSNSVLESVRLRILWSMNSGDVSMNTIDQREVVFVSTNSYSHFRTRGMHYVDSSRRI